jgi:HlyD family secretion protein
MNTLFSKIKTFIQTHKKTSIAIGILFLIVVYAIYRSTRNTAGETSYVIGTVEKSTIVSSISGSGQVSAGRMLEVKPEASGTVVYIGVKEGQEVFQGALIAQLDSTSAQKSVRDAEANLRSAQISKEKLQQPADSLSILQAENSLTQSKNDLAKAYEDSFNTISNTFLDLPTAMTGLDSILHGVDADPSQNAAWNVSYYGDSAAQFETAVNEGKGRKYASDADQKYTIAKAAYDKNFNDYKNSSRNGDTTATQNLLNQTYETAKLVSDAVKATQNLIQYYQDSLTGASRTPTVKSTTHITSLSGYTSKVNTDVSSLLSTKNTIANNLVTIPEKEASLAKLKAGADTLDIESSQLSLTRAQNSLQDAKDLLDNYYVRAPFTGTLAKLNVQKGDTASSGSAVATLIARDQVVDIPLNEVDVSKVSIGDKATLSFDAIDELTLTGRVAAIDTIGTVTQGVVNYTVTISFDSTDARVKPGMSTTASIITEVRADVLTVPGTAVKTSGGTSYVQVFPVTPKTVDASGNVLSKTAPERITVTTGISDDTNTEILTGLTEGQEIVVRSIAVSTNTASAPSLLGGGAQRTGASSGATREVTR